MEACNMFDHKAVISAELEEGETLLWSAQPRQDIFLRAVDKGMIPFSILWGGFALFWEYEVISTGAPFLFALFGIPFVVAGLYLMAGRFYYDARFREKTFYGITNRRVIILSGIRSKQSKSVVIREIADMNMIENPDGSGVIALDSQDMKNVSRDELIWPVQTEIKPRLSDLRDVRKPFEIIQKLRRELTVSTG
jgi:hypothetical protein